MYGMVWYGMVWYDVVWYGMVWYVCYGMVWYVCMYGMVWYVCMYVSIYPHLSLKLHFDICSHASTLDVVYSLLKVN